MNQGTTFKSLPSHSQHLWKKVLVIAIHAFIGWALCTAAMGIGMATTTVQNALIIHAAAAPFIYIVVSLSYFRKFYYTRPLVTGLIFLGFVIFMDFFLVAMLVLKSFEMFYSPLGTWIPFALILITTYLTGSIIARGRSANPA